MFYLFRGTVLGRSQASADVLPKTLTCSLGTVLRNLNVFKEELALRGMREFSQSGYPRLCGASQGMVVVL